jgi:hypothetical protein
MYSPFTERIDKQQPLADRRQRAFNARAFYTEPANPKPAGKDQK